MVHALNNASLTNLSKRYYLLGIGTIWVPLLVTSSPSILVPATALLQIKHNDQLSPWQSVESLKQLRANLVAPAPHAGCFVGTKGTPRAIPP